MPPLIRRRTVLAATLLAPLAATTAGAVGAYASTPPPAADVWAGFDDHLRRLAEAGQFSGAVLVTEHGQPLLEARYGFADRAAGAAITADTLFCIGSMGKMITAVAVGQLAERGVLAFDDLLGSHLRGFPPEIADTVTLHHLLTHTSGMGDIFGGELVTEANHTVAALVERIRTEPLRFDPGTSFSYSNAGFVVLGAVVEQVARQPYADHVREHVLAPAGMADTVVRSYRPVEVPGMAHPYALIGPDGLPLTPSPEPAPPGTELRDLGGEVKGGSPAGGAISTVGDMTAFARALTGHHLLSADLTDTLLAGKVTMAVSGPTPPSGSTPSPQQPAPAEPPRYGYGFSDRRRNGVRIVGHNGGTPGYEGQLDIYPDTGHTVVVLTNQDRSLPAVVKRAEELLTG